MNDNLMTADGRKVKRVKHLYDKLGGFRLWATHFTHPDIVPDGEIWVDKSLRQSELDDVLSYLGTQLGQVRKTNKGRKKNYPQSCPQCDEVSDDTNWVYVEGYDESWCPRCAEDYYKDPDSYHWADEADRRYHAMKDEEALANPRLRNPYRDVYDSITMTWRVWRAVEQAFFVYHTNPEMLDSNHPDYNTPHVIDEIRSRAKTGLYIIPPNHVGRFFDLLIDSTMWLRNHTPTTMKERKKFKKFVTDRIKTEFEVLAEATNLTKEHYMAYYPAPPIEKGMPVFFFGSKAEYQEKYPEYFAASDQFVATIATVAKKAGEGKKTKYHIEPSLGPYVTMLVWNYDISPNVLGASQPGLWKDPFKHTPGPFMSQGEWDALLTQFYEMHGTTPPTVEIDTETVEEPEVTPMPPGPMLPPSVPKEGAVSQTPWGEKAEKAIPPAVIATEGISPFVPDETAIVAARLYEPVAAPLKSKFFTIPGQEGAELVWKTEVISGDSDISYTCKEGWAALVRERVEVDGEEWYICQIGAVRNWNDNGITEWMPGEWRACAIKRENLRKWLPPGDTITSLHSFPSMNPPWGHNQEPLQSKAGEEQVLQYIAGQNYWGTVNLIHAFVGDYEGNSSVTEMFCMPAVKWETQSGMLGGKAWFYILMANLYQMQSHPDAPSVPKPLEETIENYLKQKGPPPKKAGVQEAVPPSPEPEELADIFDKTKTDIKAKGLATHPPKYPFEVGHGVICTMRLDTTGEDDFEGAHVTQPVEKPHSYIVKEGWSGIIVGDPKPITSNKYKHPTPMWKVRFGHIDKTQVDENWGVQGFDSGAFDLWVHSKFLHNRPEMPFTGMVMSTPTQEPFWDKEQGPGTVAPMQSMLDDKVNVEVEFLDPHEGIDGLTGDAELGAASVMEEVKADGLYWLMANFLPMSLQIWTYDELAQAVGLVGTADLPQEVEEEVPEGLEALFGKEEPTEELEKKVEVVSTKTGLVHAASEEERLRMLLNTEFAYPKEASTFCEGIDILSKYFVFTKKDDKDVFASTWLIKNGSCVLKGAPGTGKTTLIQCGTLLWCNRNDWAVGSSDYNDNLDELLKARKLTIKVFNKKTYKKLLSEGKSDDDAKKGAVEWKNVRMPMLSVAKHNMDKEPDELFYYTDISTERRDRQQSFVGTGAPVLEVTEEAQVPPGGEDTTTSRDEEEDDIVDEGEEAVSLPSARIPLSELPAFKPPTGPAIPQMQLPNPSYWARDAQGTLVAVPFPTPEAYSGYSPDRVDHLDIIRFEPRPYPIVSAVVKLQNEANRMNANVADAMLGLLAENMVEYRGKAFASPADGRGQLNFFDYNPHLDLPPANMEMDRALLDRIDIGFYLPGGDIKTRMKVLLKHTVEKMTSAVKKKDQKKKGEKVSKKLLGRPEDGVFTEIIERIEADEPVVINHNDLRNMWSEIQRIPITTEVMLWISFLTNLPNFSAVTYGDTYADFEAKTPNDLIEQSIGDTKYMDTTLMTYRHALRSGIEDQGGDDLSLYQEMQRPFGFRSALSFLKLLRAYKTIQVFDDYRNDYFAYLRGDANEPKPILFRDLGIGFWENEAERRKGIIEIGQLLPYVLDHRVNIGVGMDMMTAYSSFFDFVKYNFIGKVVAEGVVKQGWDKWMAHIADLFEQDLTPEQRVKSLRDTFPNDFGKKAYQDKRTIFLDWFMELAATPNEEGTMKPLPIVLPEEE